MAERIHRVLIVGAGSIGERHLRCFAATDRTETSFVEVRSELRAQITGRYPHARGFSSLEEALALPFDVAVIATPAPMHIAQAHQCITRGINVLIEKPLSVELEGATKLLSAIRESNCVAGTAYVYRANPVLAEFREYLKSGQLGKPVQLVAVCGQSFPTYRPAYAQTYYADHASGGGAVQDALTHVLNAGEWIVGGIDKVVADLDHLLLANVNVEDTAHVLARHGTVMANYSLNQHQAANEIVITIACERGTLRYENHHSRWRRMEKPDGPWIDSAPVTLERDTLFIRQANAFLDAVERKQPVLCTVEEGLATLLVNRAILKSAATGGWCSPADEKVM